MPDGTLMMGDIFGNPARWVEVGDGVFRAAERRRVRCVQGRRRRPRHARGRTVPADRRVAHRLVRVRQAARIHRRHSACCCSSRCWSARSGNAAPIASSRQLRWARPTLALSGALLLLFLVVIATDPRRRLRSPDLQDSAVAVLRADAAAARDPVRAARGLVRGRRLARRHVDVRCTRCTTRSRPWPCSRSSSSSTTGISLATVSAEPRRVDRQRR